MQHNQPKTLNAIWSDVQKYLNIRLELLKLVIVEKSSRLIADLITNTIVLFCMVLSFLVSAVTLAFYLSRILNSYTSGFGCAALFFTGLAFLVLWKKGALEKAVAGLAIRRYFEKHCEVQQEKEKDKSEVHLKSARPEISIAKQTNQKQQPAAKKQAMKKEKVTFKGLWEVLKNSFNGFSDHKVTKLSGSLAYYTVFSMAPLLLVIISLCGIFLGQEAAQGQIYAQLAGFVGKDTALQMQDIVAKAAIGDKGTVAFIIGIVTLLVGSTTVFADIQDSINTIWGLKPKPKRGWLKMLQNRFLSFSVIISLVFLLLISLSITTVLDNFNLRLQARFSDVSVVFFYILNQVVTLVVISLIFGVIFKVLPDANIKWRDVAYGAIVTALLFMLGKFGISIYIGQSDVGSTYGAAGSLVILLLWTYYSSIILYFGAEFTKAYALAYGSEIHPSHYAVTTKEIEIETGNNSIQDNAS
ncbi:YihY/virulence factor BrkB family protein [Pedobacter sp. MC2016-14]|uniref:YihY/virulence factor BrkB family protein n=1 Tax=Pedobacter sp. MC2016-14 TaxID=2897327 RepID=UPI001E3B39C2|nr:YihY/virulence factor BrkB family protein [Pedobacter sp. MC2016-14]MCD0490202.1 YihY/virulence factor BrkB family protein [Pedobacter sp. MC2016-14]